MFGGGGSRCSTAGLRQDFAGEELFYSNQEPVIQEWLRPKVLGKQSQKIGDYIDDAQPWVNSRNGLECHTVKDKPHSDAFRAWQSVVHGGFGVPPGFITLKQLSSFEALGQSVFCTDLHGIITYWSKNAEALYLWKSEEVIGLNVLDILFPLDALKCAKEILSHVGQGKSWSGEHAFIRRDGVLINTMVISSPLIGEDNHIEGIVAISSALNSKPASIFPDRGLPLDSLPSTHGEATANEPADSNITDREGSLSSHHAVESIQTSTRTSLFRLGLISVQHLLRKFRLGAGKPDSEMVAVDQKTDLSESPELLHISYGGEYNAQSSACNPQLQARQQSHPLCHVSSLDADNLGAKLPSQCPSADEIAPFGNTTSTSSGSIPCSSIESPYPFHATSSEGNSSAFAVRNVVGENFNSQQAEEDFHLQMALALRVSAEGAVVDDPTDPTLSISRAGTHPEVSKAEATSYRYWVTNCLGYDDWIEDGFYELWGMSPHVWSICTDSAEQGRMPPLESLRCVHPSEAAFDVVLVDRKVDPGLCTLEERVVHLAYEAKEILDLACQLGKLVALAMGGPVVSADDLIEAWQINRSKLMQISGTIVLPIGMLKTGSSRQRALLFKVLADSVGLPCRLVRGFSFCSKEEEAFALVKCSSGREWMVDLVYKPGLLMPPEARASSSFRPASFPVCSSDSGNISRNNAASPLRTSNGVPSSLVAVHTDKVVSTKRAPENVSHLHDESAPDAAEHDGKLMQSVQITSKTSRYKEHFKVKVSATDGENIKKMMARDGGDVLDGDPGSLRIAKITPQVEEYKIKWEDINIGERVGQGSFGRVFHADWQGSDVAVKVFLDQDIRSEALEEFKREVAMIRRLRHPNIVLFMGAVTKPPNLSLVTEFCPRGSLFRILQKTKLDERRRLRMALDVAKGMNYLHRCCPPIVHRDLKSPNLLVKENWTIKVCDFGLSRPKNNTFLTSKTGVGTPEWTAPEVLRNEPSDEKCDVYSFGVILWELALLQQPWAGMSSMQVIGAVGYLNQRLPIPDHIDPSIASLMEECWSSEPKLRPSFGEIMHRLKTLPRCALTNQASS